MGVAETNVEIPDPKKDKEDINIINEEEEEGNWQW